MKRHVSSDREGGIMIMVAAGLLAIVGAVGIAVDIGRGQMVLSKLQNAVDAAALAAGASLNTNDLNAVATKYVNLNFSQSNLGATLTNVTTTLSEDRKIITVSATADMPTTITKIFDRTMMTLDTASEVTRSNKGLEVALVLDTTGSMSGTKLTALKNASHDLLDILFGDDATQENLWVGVVPFSQSVNVGPTRTGWLNAGHYSSLMWAPSTWAGCVEARYTTGRDITDDPPYDLALPNAPTPSAPYERLRAYYYPMSFWSTSGSTTSNTTICSGSSSCNCTNYGPCSSTPTQISGNQGYTISCTGTGSSASCRRTTRTYALSATNGPNVNCPSAITPLTNTKATAAAGIDALVARGNTHVNFGAVWGWRLISPRWRGYWGGAMNTNNLPLDYNTPLMSKAVVIMTDGANTGSSSNYSAYPVGSGISPTALNTKTTQVCNAIKAQGIIVYTILFQETNTTIKDLMRNCATNQDYFFDSPTPEALQTAFQTIGDSLANLRISR